LQQIWQQIGSCSAVHRKVQRVWCNDTRTRCKWCRQFSKDATHLHEQRARDAIALHLFSERARRVSVRVPHLTSRAITIYKPPHAQHKPRFPIVSRTLAVVTGDITSDLCARCASLSRPAQHAKTAHLTAHAQRQNARETHGVWGKSTWWQDGCAVHHGGAHAAQVLHDVATQRYSKAHLR